MDREFTWNQVAPNEAASYGSSRQAEIDEIRSRIDALKAEREQLVAQLGDEYSDERLGAQMLRAGDEGAMYKFLRGQQDQMKLNAADKEKTGIPSQADFDKVLETLQATDASLADPKLDPNVKTKYELMLDLYRNQLNDMLVKNPNLSMRNYNPRGTQVSPAPDGGVKRGGDLYELRQTLGWGGSGMTDAEIDAEVAKYKGKVDVDELTKVADEAKKRNETAYGNYKKQIDADNARMKTVYNTYLKAKDPETRLALEGLLKGYINAKTGKFVSKKYLSKDKWVKGK